MKYWTSINKIHAVFLPGYPNFWGRLGTHFHWANSVFKFLSRNVCLCVCVCIFFCVFLTSYERCHYLRILVVFTTKTKGGGGVRVRLTIWARNFEQNIDILWWANLCTFHLDPSIVQRFVPFLAQKSVLVFLRFERKYKKLYFLSSFYRLVSFSVLSFVPRSTQLKKLYPS